MADIDQQLESCHRAQGSVESASVQIYAADGHVRPLRQIEADVIRLAIVQYQGRLSEVARHLGIGRSTLYRKLDELGIN